MSGLLALLDDVAAIAKMAAVHVDDVTALAAKAGVKSAGVVIDDAAVTPKYVQGLPAARELPIVLKIARGSLFNKLVILLPAALLINAVAPFLLTPILMIGGGYLCFEGAEKIVHVLFHRHGTGDGHGPGDDATDERAAAPIDAAHLEAQRVSGAIKTDFVLSAEITAIALAAIETDVIWKSGLVLAAVAVGITALVYGAVAILVKADDVGLRMASAGRLGATRVAGRAIVKAMPTVTRAIGAIGTAAMLWVGGSIVVHGLKDVGVKTLYDAIHAVAHAAASAVAGLAPVLSGFAEWATTAALDGLFGLLVGLALIPVVSFGLAPAARAVRSLAAGRA
ncbi:MAG: DUF808 domain-containing protein [Pseudomonadota bacterium]